MRRLLIAGVLLSCQRAPEPSGGAARVVTLTPSATEIVAALGAADELVGVDKYSVYPPAVQKLPAVGDFMTPNLEAIVRLRPTLVIVDDIQGQAAAALRDAGVAAIECPMHDLPDVKSGLRAVGARLGRVREAEAAVDGIDAALDHAAAARPAHHPHVLAVIDREAGGVAVMTAAGPGSWIDELLAVVGGDNVLPPSSVRYARISPEEVLRAAPDVILDLSQDTDLAPWQTLDVPAVRDHRVRSLGDDMLKHPSPRVAEALAAVAAAIK